MRNLSPLTFRKWTVLFAALIFGITFCTAYLCAQERKPLTKDEIVGLLKGDVVPQRVAELAQENGIDFAITPEVESELRQAGATDGLLATLRDLASKRAKPAQIIVETSPAAQVYLDDIFRGQASPEGRLVIANPTPGKHTLRVSLPKKMVYETPVTVAAGQVSNVQAKLADLRGTIRVQTSTGAEVFLDDSSKGTAGPDGQLVIPDVAGGAHALRVTAKGKKDYAQSVTVAAGQEIKIEAKLPDAGPVAGAVWDNPKDGLKYVWIPPGSFMMGCSPGDKECRANEEPAHHVTITKGFWMGQTEVTVGAFDHYAAATGAKKPRLFLGNKFYSDDNQPVVGVNWNDARDYCQWAGGRLPTEAQWEYAARGGNTQSRYGDIDTVGWYGANSRAITHDVGRKRANGFGLFDVLGNVWEWVNDWYDPNYYKSSPAQDPAGPTSGTLRVFRGGSWYDIPPTVRVSFRLPWAPNFKYSTMGFRCVGKADGP
jgi:formylglycine-generating enzyme required for sulfatase activity